MAFVHLHVHSGIQPARRRLPHWQAGAARAKELGQTALAITDHGVMYGVIDFYRAAKAAGIKPIIGCEVYVAPRTHGTTASTAWTMRRGIWCCCAKTRRATAI